VNKRIQELVQQATSELQSYSYRFGNTSETYFDKEKFAELIIQDIIQTIKTIPEGYKDYRNQIEDAFREDCIEILKTKFGVKDAN
jgi:hypothetical protein